MTELKAILLIMAFVILTLLLGGVLLIVVVEIMMADEINSMTSCRIFYDRNDNSDDD